jgi:hypothetical protein
MSRPRFRTRRTEDTGQDPHWQDVQSPASWLHLGKTSSLRPVGCISNQFPTRGIPTTSLRLAREVFVSHEKSPPRTTSLYLTREVSASLNLPRAPTGAWAMAHSASPRLEHHRRRMWGNDSPRHANTTVGPTGCAAIPSPSSPTLPHTSSTQGTRAPSTTRMSLELGSSVAG